MSECSRRIVVELPFEATVGEASRAIREEGLQTIARIDVRDQLWRAGFGYEPRRYFLLEAWSPELSLEALRHDRDAGTILPTRFAIYETADGNTAFVANEPFSPSTADPHWQETAPPLAAIAHREAERVARVFDRLQHRARRPASTGAPA